MSSTHILCIETATKVCSVALFRDEELVSIREESSEKYIHSEKLATFIDECMKESGVKYVELSAVAVSAGPGSYTGLRIGVSTVKGICFGAGLPLLAIPNLEQLAHAAIRVNPEFDAYLPMIDARRMEVFTGGWNREGEQFMETSAVEVDEGSFSALQNMKICILGDGAAKCVDTLGHLEVELIEMHCTARNMGKLALEKFKRGETEDLAYYEPFYLKEFVAGKPKKLL